MKAIRKQNEIEYIVYNNNIDEVATFLNGRTSFKIEQLDMFDSIEEAKGFFEESLYDDQVHGELSFESLEAEGEWFYTKEGKVLLSADIDWNRYDKQYYFIEDMKITVKETLPIEEPVKELYINSTFIKHGLYIVFDDLAGISILDEAMFFNLFDIVK